MGGRSLKSLLWDIKKNSSAGGNGKALFLTKGCELKRAVSGDAV